MVHCGRVKNSPNDVDLAVTRGHVRRDDPRRGCFLVFHPSILFRVDSGRGLATSTFTQSRPYGGYFRV